MSSDGEMRVRNVLFLCTHNSARSVLAEAILNRRGAGRFRGFSAGSHPRGTVNPDALALLRRLGHDVSGVSSKSWDVFAGPDAPCMDFIFTVCDDAAGETCPVWPGHPVSAHWGVPDPSRAVGTAEEIAKAWETAHARLDRRIAAFLALPFDALDTASLKSALARIGDSAVTDENE